MGSTLCRVCSGTIWQWEPIVLVGEDRVAHATCAGSCTVTHSGEGEDLVIGGVQDVLALRAEIGRGRARIAELEAEVVGLRALTENYRTLHAADCMELAELRAALSATGAPRFKVGDKVVSRSTKRPGIITAVRPSPVVIMFEDGVTGPPMLWSTEDLELRA